MSIGRIIGALGGAVLLAAKALPCAHAASPPPLELYGQLPKTEAVDISADGTMVAVVETLGEQRMLTVRRLDGSVVAKAEVGDLKLAGLEWAGNDHIVVFVHQTASLALSSRYDQEFLQGVVVDLKEGRARPLLPQSREYIPAIFGRYGFINQGGHM